jgi:transposase
VSPTPAAETLIPSLEDRFAQVLVQVERLSAQGEQLTHERDEYKKLYLLLREENERLKRGLLGQKAERLGANDQQLSLQMLELLLGQDAASPSPPAAPAVEQPVAAHSRRQPVRQALPEHLPRVTIELIPLEVQQQGLDHFECIGTERREVLERRPASLVVVEFLKRKYVPKDRPREGATTVLKVETPELPIERGLAGPGLLADTVVKRWQDHLPLHRQMAIFAREGLVLARSTICTWHEQLAALVRLLVEAMRDEALQQPYLCVDATGVLVQAKEKCRHGHFWVLVAPELHVLFNFSAHHDSAAVDQLLPGYQGYLVADAHIVYDHLYCTGKVIEVGCWSHARRYHFKALPSDPDRAKLALGLIGALFRLERTLAGASARDKLEARQRQSKPLVDQFFTWCATEADRVLDESPMAKAIGYAQNQEVALRRFLEDGRLPLHNNLSELQLRREAIGRKNWLFVGSEEGAEVNALFVSLLASCSLHRLEPWAYLRDLFCLLPSWPRSRVLELAPAYFKHTLEQHEAQEKLAANPYRQVVLGSHS